MRRISSCRLMLGIVPVAAAIAAPAAVGAATVVAVIDAPADGTAAAIIAQGVVTFGDGQFHWTSESVAINPTAAPFGSNAAGFVVASGPVAAVVSSSAGSIWRLGPGEAAFRPAATTNRAVAEAEGAASLLLINIDAGPGNGVFVPGAGPRDVDLVLAQLAPSSSLTVPVEVSAFLYVTAGVVATGDTTIGAGTTAVRDGDVTLANDGAATATVLVATVGRAVDVLDGGPEVEALPPGDDGSTSPPPAPSASSPAATTPAATTPAATDPPATADVDGDGLTGADEQLRGTDPGASDTDGDGLDDGFEVFDSGTNPTVADGDGDGASDGQEVAAGTNPNLDEDSDGDGVPDADEILSGGDPFDPDDQP